MNYKNVLYLLIGGFFVFLCAENVESPKELTTLIKKAQTEESIEKAIKMLGLPDSLIDYYNKIAFDQTESKLFETTNFVRADVFKSNLNIKPDSEFVTQVIFKYGSEIDNTAHKIYFVFINGDSNQKYQVLWYQVFDNYLCNLLTSGKTMLRFEFDKSRGYSKLLFQRNIVESCGLELASHDQIDTLFFKDERYVFTMGLPFNAFFSNRMDVTE